MDLISLKDEIAAAYDEASLLDFLGIDILDLIEILEEQINERKEDFESEFHK